MASRKVRELLDAFRSHFVEEAGGAPPLSLRQESTDVVFTAMLEDDAPVEPSLSPLLSGMGEVSGDPLGDVGAAFGPVLGEAMGGGGADLESLLGLGGSGGFGDALGGAGGLPEGLQSTGDVQPPSDLSTLLGG